jgi:hypothetical protein
MSLFRRSPRYPGLLGHPVFALGVLLFCGISFATLGKRPVEPLPLWWDFALTGSMLLLIGPMLVFFVLLCSKAAQMYDAVLARSGVTRYADGTSWLDLIVSRELAAIGTFAVYVVVVGAHRMEGLAPPYAFQQCVAGLHESGLTYLAKTLPDVPTQQELTRACQQAGRVDAKRVAPKPETVAELKMTYGQ